jgi:hypothetical protein
VAKGGGTANCRKKRQITPFVGRSEWDDATAAEVPPLHPDDREIGLVRVWRALFWTLWSGGALVAPAAGQNLDAGKPPAQIFSEVCAACHKNVRDFKGGVSSYFLREHYTTSSDMASTMAAYLSGVRSDPRAAPSSPPKPVGTPAAARDAAPTDNQGRTPQPSEPKAAQAPSQPPSQPPAANRTTRPGTARADASKPAAETKPPQPPLEEFEE